MKHEAIVRKQARQERDARRGRLGKGRADALVKELATVIRLAFEAGATASIFGLEGPLRHAIRSDLCLQGWSWTDADIMAREMLEEVFRVVRAKRPSWNEGQREWAIAAGTLIERTRCVRCCKPLPEGHFKFCGDLCSGVYHSALSLRRQVQGDRAVDIAVRSI